ncbi:MAG: hypothetical protein H8Z69_00560 [Nanohaloarchaea archaeon]|nr:hypothetical protein [Candidatus Nanohaloarchaea archaeon]
MADESSGFRIIQLTVKALLVEVIAIFGAVAAVFMQLSFLTAQSLSKIVNIAIPLVILTYAAMWHGYKKDKEYLKQKYGKTPSAKPIKGIGLFLYSRQRAKIVE